MDSTLIRFLSCLSRATLDPALGGRGMVLSRVLSLAAFGVAKNDADALQNVEAITAKIEQSLNTPRHLTHEEWNELQASAETGHWFLRAQFPQVAADGAVEGGYQAPDTIASPTHSSESYIIDESQDVGNLDTDSVSVSSKSVSTLEEEIMHVARKA